MEGEVEVVEVVVAGTEKVAEVRVGSEVVVGIGSYQDTLSAVTANQVLLLENQSVAVAGRVGAGQDIR
jgi:hypothetical protein